MRKIVLILIVVFGLLFVGCDPNAVTGTTPTPEGSGSSVTPIIPAVVKKALNGLSLLPNDSTNESVPVESLISGIEEHHAVIAESNRFLTAIAVFTEAREKFEKIRNDRYPTDEVGVNYNILTSAEYAKKEREHDTAIIQFRKDRGRFIRGLKFIKERRVIADEIVEFFEETRDYYNIYTLEDGTQTNRVELLNKVLDNVERCTDTEDTRHYDASYESYGLLNEFKDYRLKAKERTYTRSFSGERIIDELGTIEKRPLKLTLLRKLKEEFDPEEDYANYWKLYQVVKASRWVETLTVKAEYIGWRRIKAETDYEEFRKKFWELARNFYGKESAIAEHKDAATTISIINDFKNAWEEIIELLNTIVQETKKERDYIYSL